MTRRFAAALLPALGLLLSAPASRASEPAAPVPMPSSICNLAHAGPWIGRWLDAWRLTSREILRIPDAGPPEIVLFDSLCVYTTSARSAPGAVAVDGPSLLGIPLPWRAAAHGDSIVLPTGDRTPVALMSFAGADTSAKPFFVMAAPSYWEGRATVREPALTGVFLHEFAHTRQTAGMAGVLGPIDANWKEPESLDDDVVQTRFSKDSAYVANYREERDLIYRAAGAKSIEETRTLARRALAMMRRRHERWFHGGSAVFAALDNLWLSAEGAGQWCGYAWLAHPRGGGLDPAGAESTMSGRRRRWSQDEGLGLFLVIDRLMPGWPTLVFGERTPGALDLLERAIKTKPEPMKARGRSRR